MVHTGPGVGSPMLDEVCMSTMDRSRMRGTQNLEEKNQVEHVGCLGMRGYLRVASQISLRLSMRCFGFESPRAFFRSGSETQRLEHNCPITHKYGCGDSEQSTRRNHLCSLDLSRQISKSKVVARLLRFVPSMLLCFSYQWDPKHLGCWHVPSGNDLPTLVGCFSSGFTSTLPYKLSLSRTYSSKRGCLESCSWFSTLRFCCSSALAAARL